MNDIDINKILEENKVLKEENKRLHHLLSYIKRNLQDYDDGMDQYLHAIDAEKQAKLRQAYLEADKGIVGKLMIKLEDLPLSGRVKTIFRGSVCKTLGDIAALNKSDIRRYRGMGVGRLKEIEDILEFYGLEFGMDTKGIIEETLKHYTEDKI